jgi:hypothetical protein
MNGADALAAALEAEYAAIFGYGVVGAHLDDNGMASPARPRAAHRDRRDAVSLRIIAASASRHRPGRRTPSRYPVADGPSALKLAVALEEGAAGAWRQALRGDQRRRPQARAAGAHGVRGPGHPVAGPGRHQAAHDRLPRDHHQLTLPPTLPPTLRRSLPRSWSYRRGLVIN